MQNLNLSRALKRISRDYLELQNEPCLGIGLAKMTPNNDFSYLVNIQILNGIYNGIIFQLEMSVPTTYPMNPPKMLILPLQPFGRAYHHHIFDDVNGYKKFCLDLLENNFMSTKEIGSGWSPAYSFKSIFMQIQNFLSDPDLPKDHLPNEASVKWLRNQMEGYKREFTNEEGNKVTHTSKQPYPKLGELKICPDINSFNSETIKNEEEQKMIKLNMLMERVTCFLNRNNPLNDKNVILGYPFLITYDFKRRIEPNPIPEILSYEGYMSEIMQIPRS